MKTKGRHLKQLLKFFAFKISFKNCTVLLKEVFFIPDNDFKCRLFLLPRSTGEVECVQEGAEEQEQLLLSKT
jgi:hypothetical protein